VLQVGLRLPPVAAAAHAVSVSELVDGALHSGANRIRDRPDYSPGDLRSQGRNLLTGTGTDGQRTPRQLHGPSKQPRACPLIMLPHWETPRSPTESSQAALGVPVHGVQIVFFLPGRPLLRLPSRASPAFAAVVAL
jgi:hypothetical protein